jgi:hypothetical protein
MRQIGDPPNIDRAMTALVQEICQGRGIGLKDADASTGGKDFLERILGLIRGTGFTIAVFSHETRPSAMANIALELGFAAMCGKPLVIVKSKQAVAPSDLTRTDWIDYDPAREDRARRKINQALDEIEKLAEYEELLLDVAFDARAMDCAIALERAFKAFLLTNDARLLEKIDQIRDRVLAVGDLPEVADFDRLAKEASMFLEQGRRAVAA